MTREELVWLAGWLEGEGSFYSSESKGNYPRIVIQVFSTDLDVLERAARLIGGKITVIKPREVRGSQWKSQGGWRTEIQGEPAALLMRGLFPLMGQRRKAQIEKALETWRNRRNKPVEKLCACGCGRILFGGVRKIYARHGSCAQRAYKKRTASITPGAITLNLSAVR